MTYRIMLLVELTKLSDMSDNLVIISQYIGSGDRKTPALPPVSC